MRKKAALCLLRLLRKSPPDAREHDAALPHQLQQLLDDRDPGVLVSLAALMLELVQRDPRPYVPCYPKLVNILDRLVNADDVPTEWTYYQIPSPWLQAKLMRVLQVRVHVLKHTPTLSSVRPASPVGGIGINPAELTKGNEFCGLRLTLGLGLGFSFFCVKLLKLGLESLFLTPVPDRSTL